MTTFATGSRSDELEPLARRPALRARDDDDAIGPMPSGPTKIPASRYYSPEFAKLEIEQMWPRVWQMAATTDHLAEPGDYFEYRVGPYSVLIVHGDDGVLRAFQNACRHRGNSLCVGTGSGLRELKCGYHGWTWDLQGMLRRVPARKGFGSLHLSDYPLFPALVDTWENFVFINMDVNAIPLAEYLEEMPADIAWCGLSDFHCTATLIVDVDANWKTIADGFSETYHIQGLHPELLRCVDDIHAPQQIWGHAGKSHQPYGVASPRFDGVAFRPGGVGRLHRDPGRPDGGHGVDPAAAARPGRDGAATPSRRRPATSTRRSGVDLSAYTTDEITRLHQYNVFPNMSTLAATPTS